MEEDIWSTIKNILKEITYQSKKSIQLQLMVLLQYKEKYIGFNAFGKQEFVSYLLHYPARNVLSKSHSIRPCRSNITKVINCSRSEDDLIYIQLFEFRWGMEKIHRERIIFEKQLFCEEVRNSKDIRVSFKLEKEEGNTILLPFKRI